MRRRRNLDIKLTPTNTTHWNNANSIGTYLGVYAGISSTLCFEPALEKVMHSTQNKRKIIPITCFLINLSLNTIKNAIDVKNGLNEVIDKHTAGLKLAYPAYFDIKPNTVKPSKHKLPRKMRAEIVRKSHFPC